MKVGTSQSNVNKKQYYLISLFFREV